MLRGMGLVAVNSSSIAGVGYTASSGELEVEFHNGAVYLYAVVPQAVFDALMSAESKGRFFNAHIRDVYPCTKRG